MEGNFCVALGSTSGIKREAIEMVFPKSRLELVHVESAVSPQPIGREETEKGARHRALCAKESIPECDYAVGIENGMFQQSEDQWLDAACVIVLDRCSKESLVWSEAVEIPKDMERGPQGEWSVLKDPHIVVTKGKKSRKQFIADALLKIFAK